jgi:hypothetical protein
LIDSSINNHGTGPGDNQDGGPSEITEEIDSNLERVGHYFMPGRVLAGTDPQADPHATTAPTVATARESAPDSAASTTSVSAR